jgi:hypothetical protein
MFHVEQFLDLEAAIGLTASSPKMRRRSELERLKLVSILSKIRNTTCWQNYFMSRVFALSAVSIHLKDGDGDCRGERGRLGASPTGPVPGGIRPRVKSDWGWAVDQPNHGSSSSSAVTPIAVFRSTARGLLLSLLRAFRTWTKTKAIKPHTNAIHNLAASVRRF